MAKQLKILCAGGFRAAMDRLAPLFEASSGNTLRQLQLMEALPVVGIGLYFLLRVWLTYRTTELAITNKRIIAKRGRGERA